MVLRLLLRSSAFSERECEQTNGGSQGGGVCPQELEKKRSSTRGRFSCCCSRSAARAHAFLDFQVLRSGPSLPNIGSLRGRPILRTTFTLRSCSSTVGPHSS